MSDTLSGTDIAAFWTELHHARGSRPVGDAGDDIDDNTYVHLTITVDLDFHVAYLLRVVTREPDSCDWLFVYQKHAPGSEHYQLLVEWLNEPRPFFEQKHGLPVWERFINWVGELSSYEEKA